VLHATGPGPRELGGLLKRIRDGLTFLAGSDGELGLPPFTLRERVLALSGSLPEPWRRTPAAPPSGLVVIAGLALIGGLASPASPRRSASSFLGEPRDQHGGHATKRDRSCGSPCKRLPQAPPHRVLAPMRRALAPLLAQVPGLPRTAVRLELTTLPHPWDGHAVRARTDRLATSSRPCAGARCRAARGAGDHWLWYVQPGAMQYTASSFASR